MGNCILIVLSCFLWDLKVLLLYDYAGNCVQTIARLAKCYLLICPTARIPVYISPGAP